MFVFGVILIGAVSVCGESFFRTGPKDTLAVVGDNVTLSCTVSVTVCGRYKVVLGGKPDYSTYRD